MTILFDIFLVIYISRKIKKKVIKIPTDEQLEHFISKLYDGNSNEFNVIRNIAIVKLFLGSGIRSEELINMDINDLYLEGGDKTDGRYIEKPFINVLGKGKIEIYDSVYLSPNVIPYINEYLHVREIFVKEKDIHDNALFLSNEKRRISKKVITNLFARYSNSEINPHMLRHWVGSKLYEKTKDIVKVQRQLRHDSVETASNYYVHIDDEEIADAMAML